jgi:hypothetical protein
MHPTRRDAMKRIMLTTSTTIALGALSATAYAEPVALTDAQMDAVTAGVYYTYNTDYRTSNYRTAQNARTYWYNPEDEEYQLYGETNFQWWRNYPENIGELLWRIQQEDGTYLYYPYYTATYGGEGGGPYTIDNPPPP